MPNKKRTANIMLSLILATGVLLTVSLLSLGEHALLANSQSSGVQKLHPQLYVTPPRQVAEAEERTVYFTFDDGPSKNTEALLDLLARENIKATFFVCAQAEDVAYSKSMLRRMRDEGHTIGLHTYTHQTGDIYNSVESYLDDLAKIDAFIYEATGLHPNILRFPGGSRTSNCDRALMRTIADEVTRRGYVFYDWTVPTGDDGPVAAPAGTIVSNILEGVKGRQSEIILCHDNATPTTTPAAVEQAIPLLREQGYRFDRLTNQVPPIQFVNQ